MKKLSSTAGLCFVALLTGPGCVTANYREAEPIHPKPVVSPASDWDGVTQAESAQPTFEWRPLEPFGGSYDLIVYLAVSTQGELAGFENWYERGEEVYYREALTSASHKLEIPLQPKQRYFWSVRRRSGSEVSPWATWDRRKVFGSEENIWWMFLTPAAGS